MIRPASPGLKIYYLFHKEPVRGLILKYFPPPPRPRRLNGAWPSRNVGLPLACLGLFCETQWRHRNSFWIATRWKKCYTRPPPPYFIVSATCSSVSVCFIDYDPSVGNMGAVARIKANTRADAGNSPNVVSILGQHLHSWHNIVCTGTLWLVNATRIYE